MAHHNDPSAKVIKSRKLHAITRLFSISLQKMQYKIYAQFLKTYCNMKLPKFLD